LSVLLHRLLEFGSIYELLQRYIGSGGVRRYFADHYVRASAETVVVDFGCGPGTMLAYLGNAGGYLGVDDNSRYIEFCLRRYGTTREFQLADIAPAVPALTARFDIAMAVGVLHHLPDEAAVRLFRNALAALRPGGRLVTLDGAYRKGQPFLARLLNRMDRGDFVRTDAAYEALARSVFPEVRRFDFCGRLIVPVTHCVMECIKPAGTS
jgi:SAM-dependent methyltransferase